MNKLIPILFALAASLCAQVTSIPQAAGGGGGGGGLTTQYTTYSNVSGTPTFTVASGTAIQDFKINLTGNVTASTLNVSAATTGQDIAFHICEPLAGGMGFVWPTNVTGGGSPDAGANICTDSIGRFDGTNVVIATPGFSTDTPTKIGPGPERAAPTTCAGAGLEVYWFDATNHLLQGCANAGSLSTPITMVKSVAARTANQYVTFVGTGGTQTTAQPQDADINFTAVTTGNVSTSKHGYTPILPNNAAVFLNGTGAYTAPAGTGCTVLGSSGDYLVPGAAWAISAYPESANAQYPFSPSAGNTLIATRVFIPCSWTPNNLTIYIDTAGTAGCKYSVGVYSSAGTLLISSGVMTNTTTIACSSIGAKEFTSGTTPAATGLGTTYAAGFYWITSTGNETNGIMEAFPFGGNKALALNQAVVQVGYNSTGSTNGVSPSTLPSLTGGAEYLPMLVLGN
jgi:hypothetical protein